MSIQDTELGKRSTYGSTYDAERLFPILRQQKRADIDVSSPLPFQGYDVWNHYEVSWLNDQGKPIVAICQCLFDAASPYLIESKSMKLYFNSFNNTQFNDANAVAAIIKQDLETRVQAPVEVRIVPLKARLTEQVVGTLAGTCIDDLSIGCSIYEVDPTLLTTETVMVEEVLYSDLLRSNCLVTGQPDWASVQIAYRGPKINHASLLRYIVSYRNHTEFGEHCIERVFMDIMRHCKPSMLTVGGYYTRRGGIDINCFRSTEQLVKNFPTLRLVRQ